MAIRQHIVEEIVPGPRRPNTIVTRGFGKKQQIVTRGYGGIFTIVKKVISTVVAAGQSGTKRALREIEEAIVWVKLIRVNNSPPPKAIQGSVKVNIDRLKKIAVKAVTGIDTRVRNVWQDIKITVKRIK